MPKMHYFKNNFSSITKRCSSPLPAPLNLRFWWPEVTRDVAKFCFIKQIMTKSNFKKSVMPSL